MTDSVNPNAGWYPDPQVPGTQRWWDGNAWTEYTQAIVQPTPAPTPAATPPAPATMPEFIPPVSPGAAAPGTVDTPTKKSGSTFPIVLLVGLAGALVLTVIGGAALLFLGSSNDELVEAVSTSASSEGDVDEVDDAPDEASGSNNVSPGSDADTTTSTTEDSQPATTTDFAGADGVLSCTRNEGGVLLELVNGGTETSTYFLTVGFFDDAGTRLADEFTSVNSVRPGERVIQEFFMFEDAGTVCEIIETERFPVQSEADQLAEVEDCVIGSEPDAFGDFSASVSVTNTTSITSDYSIDAAFMDAEGIRRGHGSAFIQSVRPQETAPGDFFTTAEFAEGFTCEIVAVVRFDS